MFFIFNESLTCNCPSQILIDQDEETSVVHVVETISLEANNLVSWNNVQLLLAS